MQEEDHTMTTTNSPEPYFSHLPGEVLQNIFQRFDFYDLLSCQRVCRSWCAYCPGAYSKLRESLFLESACTPLAKIPQLTMTFGVEESVCLDEKCGLPGFKFELRMSCAALEGEAEGDESDREDEEKDVKEECEEGSKDDGVEAGSEERKGKESQDRQPSEKVKSKMKVRFHPFVEDLASYLGIIHPSFQPAHTTCPNLIRLPTQTIFFSSPPNLGIKTKYQPELRKDGSWKHMLACVPPAMHIAVRCKWETSDGRVLHWQGDNLRGPEGVELQALAELLKTVLEHADLHASELCDRIVVRGHWDAEVRVW
jgi:hypothetical protein